MIQPPPSASSSPRQTFGADAGTVRISVTEDAPSPRTPLRTSLYGWRLADLELDADGIAERPGAHSQRRRASMLRSWSSSCMTQASASAESPEPPRGRVQVRIPACRLTRLRGSRHQRNRHSRLRTLAHIKFMSQTHPGVGQHRHRQVAPCPVRDSGVERTHQPTWAERDLHGAGLLRPDPLARLSDHSVDQLITPAMADYDRPRTNMASWQQSPRNAANP